MARLRKFKRDEGPGGSGGGDDSSTDDDNSSTVDNNPSTEDDDSSTESRTTSSSTTSTSRPSPAPVNVSTTTSSPVSRSINSGDIVRTTSGEIVYRTTTEGRTITITTGLPQSSASSASASFQNSGSSGLSTEATAGIAVAVVVSVLLAAGIFLLLFFRKRNKKPKPRKTEMEIASEMASSSNADPPESGQQTLQSLSYGGMAELHNVDKAVETSGRPVYEMSGSTPEREIIDETMLDTVEPPEYTARAEPSTRAESGGPEINIVSPVEDESTTYAPGDVIISPLDAKIRD